MSRLANKVALVTGANAGIGLAVARRFIAEGATVFAVGRRQAPLDAARAELGTAYIPVAADITLTADRDRVFQRVRDEAGQLDILVANAGIVRPTKLADIDEAHYASIFDLNAKATLFTVQAAVPLLRRPASIVLIGSTGATTGIPGYLTYGGSKAALRSFARTLTAEFRDNGIRVNTLSPGPIDTDFIDDQAATKEGADKLRQVMKKMIPLGRMGRPDEVAAAALFLASEESSFIAGADLVIDGGTTQI